MGTWWLVRGGGVLQDEAETLYEGDHIQVHFMRDGRGKGG